MINNENPYAPPEHEAVGHVEKIKDKNPWQYFIGAFIKFAVFRGRARRAEYWWFRLFNIIFTISFAVLDILFILYMNGSRGVLRTIWVLVALIPGWAVTVRRMHDCDKSGWFMLVPIYNFILCCTEGTYGDNYYGPDSKWKHTPDADINQNALSSAMQKKETKNCPFCSYIVEVSANFCSHCGKNIFEYENEQKKHIQEKYKTLEDFFNDESIMKEAKDLRRIYGKSVFIAHLKNKAKELGLGEIEINENDIE